MKVDVEKLIITIPFEDQEFTFLSYVVISTEWILIKTSIYEIEPGKMNQQALLNLFSEILKGNFLLNSVVYSLDLKITPTGLSRCSMLIRFRNI